MSFSVTPDKLAYFDKDMNFAVEPGEFEILVGSSSKDEDLNKITINVK